MYCAEQKTLMFITIPKSYNQSLFFFFSQKIKPNRNLLSEATNISEKIQKSISMIAQLVLESFREPVVRINE